jgi:hypothetical protein
VRIRSVGNSPWQPIEVITVEKLPPCEFHLEHSGEYVCAPFAGITIFETYAFMCTKCFDLYGTDLGPGKGKILIAGR